jgi:MFS family permease
VSDARAATPASAGSVRSLRLFVFALFFFFGGITSLNDVIIPKLKGLFTLNYAEVMLIQSAFFAAYFLVSIPGAAIVTRVGYMRAAVIGLLTMTAGCLLFVPASSSGQYLTFLGALLVLAAGITIVQVVTNPLISLLGKRAGAVSPARDAGHRAHLPRAGRGAGAARRAGLAGAQSPAGDAERNTDPAAARAGAVLRPHLQLRRLRPSARCGPS